MQDAGIYINLLFCILQAQFQFLTTYLFSRQAFPSGEKVTYTGKEVLCQKCVNVPVKEVARNQTASPTTSNPNGMQFSFNNIEMITVEV